MVVSKKDFFTVTIYKNGNIAFIYDNMPKTSPVDIPNDNDIKRVKKIIAKDDKLQTRIMSIFDAYNVKKEAAYILLTVGFILGKHLELEFEPITHTITKSIITERREAMGMTQEELARLTGTNVDAVINWESEGLDDVKLSTIKKIAEVLDFSMDELIWSI